MKTSVIPFTVLAFLSVNALAAEPQEMGRVISTKPVIHQMQVPQQVCSQVPVAVAEPKTGAGAVMGAIAGGAVGSTLGQGGGNAAATALGLVGGAILGDKIEGQNTVVQNTTSCVVQLMTHSTTVYQVEYEYAGRRYSVELPYDPGPTLALNVSPAVSAPPAGYAPPAAYPPPVGAVPPPMSAPTTVMAPPPVMPAPVYVAPYPYYGYPYGFYPGVGINFGVGYHRHFRR